MGTRASFRLMPGHAPLPAGSYDLDTVGYAEKEFLFEGVARSYRLVGERAPDGRWTFEDDVDAPYVSRLVVRTPTDPARFSGTVIVEWNNVSGGIDAGPDWMYFHRYLVARGHAWVGVTAQKAGIDGGGITEGFHLKLLDPERYGGLSHPGDAWSYDIFSQAGDLVGAAGGESPLGGVAPERRIAVGESQSAAFLVTYINGVDGHAGVFDGFLVHGRPGSGAGLDGFHATRPGDRADLGEVRRSLEGRDRIRDDARVPVVVLQSETDVILLGGGGPAQPDGDRIRQWEVAGAAHADTYMLVASGFDDGRLPPTQLATLMQPTTELIIGKTESPINAGPQQHYVGQAALDHLIRWAAGGAAPPAAPRLALDADRSGFLVDAHGNVEGGVRTPWVEVPTARLSGLGQFGESFAFLFGQTELFDGPTRAACYPGGRDDYLARFGASLDTTIAAGFILPDDRAEILGLAEASYPLGPG
jgi:Alpha/beta hydrolase domain